MKHKTRMLLAEIALVILCGVGMALAQEATITTPVAPPTATKYHVARIMIVRPVDVTEEIRLEVQILPVTTGRIVAGNDITIVLTGARAQAAIASFAQATPAKKLITNLITGGELPGATAD